MGALLSIPQALRIRLSPVLPQQDLDRWPQRPLRWGRSHPLLMEKQPLQCHCASFSRLFLQHVGVICHLLPASSSCSAPSFPDTAGVSVRPGFPTS